MTPGLIPSYVVELLEESIAFRRPVASVLRGGLRFVDRVREIVTAHGTDWAVFNQWGRVRVSDIAGCSRIQPAAEAPRHAAAA